MSMPVTKTEIALGLFKSGKIKEALGIFKTFKLGYTKEETKSLTIAYECMTGKESFYKSLKVDTEFHYNNAMSILKSKYSDLSIPTLTQI